MEIFQVIIRTFVFLMCLLFPIISHASAFYIYNSYSAVATGDGGAGGAALAEDATTTYSNPAGMVRVPHAQLVVSGTVIDTSLKFKGTSTWSSPGLGSAAEYGSTNGGATRGLPAIFILFPPYKQFNFGFSVTTPFGLGTYYPTDSVLRYMGTTTQLKTLDFSPNIAFKINEQWSLGGGIDLDNISANVNAVAGLPTLGPALDTLSRSEAEGWGYGWHAGALYQLTPATRVGYTYRSSVHAPLTGISAMDGPLVVASTGGVFSSVSNNDLKTTFILPPIQTLSAYHELSAQIAIEGSLNYLQWGSLPDKLVLKNVATPAGPTSPSLSEDFKNNWIIAGGLTYKVSRTWLLRTGVFSAPTPIKNAEERTINIPDSDNIGVSVGTHYQLSNKLGVDMGWTHYFFKQAPVDITTVVGAQTTHTDGNFKNQADFFAAQLTWDFA